MRKSTLHAATAHTSQTSACLLACIRAKNYYQSQRSRKITTLQSTHRARPAMIIPIVSVLLHHIRDPSEVPQLQDPSYCSSTTTSGSSSKNDVRGLDTIVGLGNPNPLPPPAQPAGPRPRSRNVPQISTLANHGKSRHTEQTVRNLARSIRCLFERSTTSAMTSKADASL